MDHRIRGLFESLVDNYFSQNKIRLFVSAIQDFKPYIKSESDFVYGWVLGILKANFTDFIYSVEKRAPTSEELEEVNNILKRRSVELRTIINREIMR